MEVYRIFCEGRAVYSGYFPASNMISFVVVDPHQNKSLNPTNIKRFYHEACQTLSAEPSVSHSIISYKVDYVVQNDEAEKIMQKAISGHRPHNHTPGLAVIECPNVHLLKSGIQALNGLPCVSIPANARDNHYPAVGWQTVAAKIALQRCAASSQWLNERISLSRYAHVPLGNLELDWIIYTIDIFFSRALRDNQQVLWISNDGLPDLGGFSEDDAYFIDEVKQPILVYPGAYRKVSVDLKVHHLAVNALLKSSQINEIEGGGLYGFEQDTEPDPCTSSEQYSFDESTSCGPAFRVLKQLVQRCLQDAVTSGNVYADAILQHLYRWLCSPQSKLHDPALYRMLCKVMQKVFALLLAEFRKLGATIIFANYSKIILDTGKADITAAKAYSDSLLKALQTRDLFEWIEIEPLHFWHSLLFMDQYNYGGIQAKDSGESSASTSAPYSGDFSGDLQGEIVSSWNIAEHLPKNTQDHFVIMVSEFMYKPWEYALNHAANEALLGDDLCTPSISVPIAEKFESLLIEYLKDQISSYFSEKLFTIVREIVRSKGLKKPQNDDMIQVDPNLNGNAHTGDAALEFIKHICAVFALDQNVQHDVLVMRRNLLKFIRVREFAPEAEFCSSLPSFVIPNIICSYCNDVRDLDLGRDPSLLTEEWRCAVPQCGQPYDREVMENSLLQIVRQRERLYHLQDLVCVKCHMMKDSHLIEQCKCAGPFKCVEDASDFHRIMQVFYRIAVQQNFHLLKECTSWILEIR